MPMSPRLLRPRSGGVHPETQDWRSRVIANGGSVSGTTLTAVDRFVKAIHAAGIRDRFFRVNLFCGNSDASLAAVRTPLFRGPSLAGTQYGNTIDTNNNFVASDYAENSGLKGNGSTKYLNTGLGTQWAGAADVSVAAYVTEADNTAFRAHMFVSQTTNGDSVGVYYRDGAVRGVDSVGSAYPSAPLGIASVGLHTLSRTASNSVRQFYNATAGTVSSTAVAARGARVMYIFAQNNASDAAPASGSHIAARIAAYHMGLGMTPDQVSSYYNAMQAFQTALGRQV